MVVEQTSEWNSALERLSEIGRLIRRANDSCLVDDFDNWYDALETLQREVCVWMTEDEEKETNEIIKQVRVWVKHNQGMITKGLDPFYIRDNLIKLEKKLRKLMHKYNLDIPAKVDPGSALRNSRGY